MSARWPALLALAAAAYGASPFAGPACYTTKRAAPLRIDGDLSEWRNVRGIALDQRKHFFVGQGMSAAKWGGPQDLSARFKVQWDFGHVFVAVEVTDDRVHEPRGSLAAGTETGSWDDDGVELMFDNDGCGMPRYFIGDPMHHEFHFVYSSKRPLVFDNFWKPKPGTPPLAFKLPDGRTEPLGYPGEVMAKNDVTARFSEAPYSGAFAFRKTAAGYSFEVRMSLPGAKMRPIGEGEHPIGFDIAINDNDAGSGPLKQQLHWSGVNDMFWRNCRFFGTLILTDELSK